MELLSSPTSPFARIVRVALIELDMADRVTVTNINPMSPPDGFPDLNPLGKVPTLLLADGAALYDSRTICDHLARHNPSRGLLPETGHRRDEVLTALSLAIGICDAAFSVVMERRRPEAQQSAEWLSRWTSGILRGTQALDASRGSASPKDLGQIGSAVALAYLDFRLPDVDWRAGNEPLDTWQTGVRRWRSMRATEPLAA
ncbi:glutathione S-transferase N-terminal domain-containing protein [Brevundimonas bacteroides]|uniref:glutathione S-transferase N-terminal domain-containing protein n=1 Tax=Brevundimonas bacteroides TaxID=74311 RepID=UPI000496CAF5|nr:glutathione S-transferase N-terminal domain-containing protein [Brevundimonas bacteroides]